MKLKKALRTKGTLRQYNQRASARAKINLRRAVFSCTPTVSDDLKAILVKERETESERERERWRKRKNKEIKPT